MMTTEIGQIRDDVPAEFHIVHHIEIILMCHKYGGLSFYTAVNIQKAMDDCHRNS
jgi:hypothetical protein